MLCVQHGYTGQQMIQVLGRQIKTERDFITLLKNGNSKFMNCLFLEFFHLIFLDHGRLWVTELTDKEDNFKVDKHFTTKPWAFLSDKCC